MSVCTIDFCATECSALTMIDSRAGISPVQRKYLILTSGICLSMPQPCWNVNSCRSISANKSGLMVRDQITSMVHCSLSEAYIIHTRIRLCRKTPPCQAEVGGTGTPYVSARITCCLHSATSREWRLIAYIIKKL